MDDLQYTSFLVGVGLIVIAIGGYFTFKMGSSPSTVSSTNKPAKAAPTASGKKAEAKAKPKYQHGPISIYFGSQTGTAEGFARTLVEEGRAAGFDAKSLDLEDFDAETLAKTELVIFLMATYGEGEPTDNAQKFIQWLKEGPGGEGPVLEKTKYVVFGLGNKQYEHFNRTGKVTNELLSSKKGATMVYRYGEGDDDGSLEEDFEAWKSGLWPALLETRGGTKEEASASSSASSLVYSFVAKVSTSSSTSSSAIPPMNQIQPSCRHFFTAQRVLVTANRELRNLQHFDKNNKGGDTAYTGSTRHLELDLQGGSLTYETADNLAVLPCNPSSLVLSMARHLQTGGGLGLEGLGEAIGEAMIAREDEDLLGLTIDLQGVEGEDYKAVYPTPCTLGDLLGGYIDLAGPVSLPMLKHLLPFTRDEGQRLWLQGLLDPAQRIASKKLLDESFHCLAGLLCAGGRLSSCLLSLTDLLHIAHPLVPRYYTISSSCRLYPSSIHLTVALTEAEVKAGAVSTSSSTPAATSKRRWTGLTSGYLSSLRPGLDSCRVFVRPSSFRLPKSPAVPLVLVGPGTGLAPMRAFLQERQHLLIDNNNKKKTNKPPALGPCSLFFGCRHEAMDFIYKDELMAWLSSTGSTPGSSTVLTSLHTAFSRDDNKQKVYVQDLMAQPEQAEAILSALLQGGGHLYVCGATQMGQDVQQTLVSLVAQRERLSSQAAAKIVAGWQEQGRYVQELWTA